MVKAAIPARKVVVIRLMCGLLGLWCDSAAAVVGPRVLSFCGACRVVVSGARAGPTSLPLASKSVRTSDEKGVTFKWKDYRLEGRARYKRMTLAPDEFIRRFLMHVLPAGFHRIRYYGLLASGKRAENIVRARELLTRRL